MVVSRRALVIGNGGYRGRLALRCPPNDAARIRQSLTELGFDVTTTFGVDLDFAAMRSVVGNFIRLVNDPATTTSLLYYSGHGVQINDRNYMIPVDFDPLKKYQEIPFVSVQSIVEQMTSATAVRIILLDACRSNADAQTFVEHVPSAKGLKIDKDVFQGDQLVTANGLASMQAEINTFIAFAAAPGKVAFEGNVGESLSPFTASFLKYIDSVDLPISNLTSRVRHDVLARTENNQKSWDQSSLMEPFYFNPGSLLLFTGNLMALVSLIVSIIPYSMVLGWSQLTWPWVATGLVMPTISLCVLLFGMQSVYSRLRGRYVREADDAITVRRHLTTSAQKGILGGYLGSSVSAMLLSALYYLNWEMDYDSFASVPLEITIATTLAAGLLGVLSLFWARASIGLGGLIISAAPSRTRILLGTTFGGILAGLIATPLIMMRFGPTPDRPPMTPDLLLPGTILGASIFIFSVVNFDFERLSARRIWQSVKASLIALGVGAMAAVVIFSPLYLLGIANAVKTYLEDNYDNMAALAKGGAAYGIPVGIVLGIVIGTAVILTERWSKKPVLD
ncbi:caspase family protein [Bradyrhizobium sp. 5.13L]